MTLSMTKRTVCVTGGAGFIGSHLVGRLMAEGARVRVLDNLSTGAAQKLPAAVELIEGDILDSKACERAMAGCDAVVHLAARVAIRSSFDFAVEDTMTNVSGSASVLKAAARTGVRKIVAASSMAVYSDSPTPTPLAETHPAEPISPYGISKLASERLTHGMAAQAGMESLVVRLFNTYGTGQLFSPYVGVVTIFANQLRAGQQPTIFGDGEQARDFVHVSDVVEGIVRAIESGVSGETLNIGSGEGRTVNQVYRAVAKAMGSAIEPKYEAAVAGELRYSIAGISKARAMLGYEPKHRFETSIAEVIEEMK
jgi:UDP-glucose 4-epimerase